jgi:hypothetical protein
MRRALIPFPDYLCLAQGEIHFAYQARTVALARMETHGVESNESP